MIQGIVLLKAREERGAAYLSQTEIQHTCVRTARLGIDSAVIVQLAQVCGDNLSNVEKICE